jgi:glycosyltransferase involved in cell wall biosynthesis
MLRRHYELMHAIIVQSVSHERWLREIGYSNHIAVIPNGVDAERFRPPIDHAERIRLRERLGFAPDVFIILTIGAVSPRKGTDLMIEAMGRISPRFSKIQLVVLGWRTDEMKNKLGGFRGKLAKLLGDPLIAERVRFEGVVDNVEEYLRAADIFLFASEREGLPNSLLEAMASRLPVITTDFIGLDVELGEPGCHYRLAERSPEGLACAVSDLLEDQSRREQLAEEGLRLVLATMRMDLALDRFGALYRRLVDKSAGC